MTEWTSKYGVEIRDIKSQYGGTMRLGSYECHLKKNTKIFEIYKKKIIAYLILFLYRQKIEIKKEI